VGAVVDMYLLERRLNRFRMAVPLVDLDVHNNSFQTKKTLVNELSRPTQSQPLQPV
jgi:hypothetical protein